MKEYACQFGEQGRLNGIVTQPSSAKTATIALILVTAGLTAKAGPFRLYTQLAREAAKKGFTTLRFDLGGIGNSQQIHAGYPLKVRTDLDIKAAVDFMESTYSIQSFVLGGLCSGAEDSFRYAIKDHRVEGVFLLDGHAYVTRGWWINHIISRKFLIGLTRRILRKLHLFKSPDNVNQGSELEGDQGGFINYQQMDIEESTAILKNLLDRNTKLHYVYTGGLIDIFNHKGQFYQMYPNIDFKNLVTLTHFPYMGHIQVFEQDRQELIVDICDWLSGSFPLPTD